MTSILMINLIIMIFLNKMLAKNCVDSHPNHISRQPWRTNLKLMIGSISSCPNSKNVTMFQGLNNPMTPLSTTREEAPILLSLDGQLARKEDNVQEKMEIISKELVGSRLFFIHFPSCHAHDEFLAFTTCAYQSALPLMCLILRLDSCNF